MQPKLKRVAAIHDLSGFGRASLTVIIPTLSVMGIQVCPVPTAVLSTHSGGFTDYAFHDLTDIMSGYTAHWKKLGLSFDCIYSGFLGSPRQAAIVSSFINDFKTERTLTVVDPVMGDNGSLYNSVSKDMVPEMRKLIAKADIIVPNFTEAALLLNTEQKKRLTKTQMKVWLQKLSDMGPGTVVITSVPDDKENSDTVHTIAYEKESGSFWKISAQRLPGMYPGTGDTFASVMIGSLLHDESLPVSIDKAAQFISQCIQSSRGYDYPHKYGILLEGQLHTLLSPWHISNFEEL